MEEDRLPAPGSVVAGGREGEGCVLLLLQDIAAAVEAAAGVGSAGAGAAGVSTAGERSAELAVPDGRSRERLSCKQHRYSQSSFYQEFGAGEDPL